MKLIFDRKMFQHINEGLEKERGHRSKVFSGIEKLLSYRVIVIPLAVFEHLCSFILTLPIPIYNSLVYTWITHSRGLPKFVGMYLRALYYRPKLSRMEPNVFIDQNVFFAHPKGVVLKEFCFIDKGVIIMSKSAVVGRRVHIAPNVLISGGGDFEIDDYACIATNSNIITSSEVLSRGARCSGPMASAAHRKVLRGKVHIKKDAFIAVNVTLLPNVTVEEGCVITVGSVITKSTEPWTIYSGPRAEATKKREKVKWPDN